MTGLIRRLLALATGVTAVLAGTAGAASASAPPGERPALHGTVLDGVVLRHLPAGLGGSTDFDYEYDGVKFVARVWESGSDAAGWRVDLDVDVMRGHRLRNARALHDWFIAYEERPPGEARYHRVRIHGHPGWRCRDEAFWLVRPGLAIAVTLDRTRWSSSELMRTARGVRAR